MASGKRYAMSVGDIGQQELDLLECLVRIDQGQRLDSRADDMFDRLVEAGLVDDDNGDPRLTLAGIERCRSLKHRVASDREAAKVLAERGISLEAIDQP